MSLAQKQVNQCALQDVESLFQISAGAPRDRACDDKFSALSGLLDPGHQWHVVLQMLIYSLSYVFTLPNIEWDCMIAKRSTEYIDAGSFW